MILIRRIRGEVFIALVLASAVSAAYANPLYDTALVHYEFQTLGSGGEVTDSNTNHVDLIAFDTSASGITASLVPGPGGGANTGIALPDFLVLTSTGVVGSDPSVLDTTRDTPFTVASWVRVETELVDRLYLVSKVAREDLGDGDGLELRGWSFTLNAGGQLEAIWRFDHTPLSGTVGENRIIVRSDTGITDNAWHHVALTFDYDELDATRGMKIYIDGIMQASTALNTGLAGTNDIDLSASGWPLNLGGRYDTQLNEGGYVDDLAVWKSVLSPQDIASLAGVTLGTPGDFDLDDDVDGRDFLIWQRGGSPSPLTSTDLSDWQANYGAPLLAAESAGVTSVPEPAAMTLLIAGFAGFWIRNRRL